MGQVLDRPLRQPSDDLEPSAPNRPARAFAGRRHGGEQHEKAATAPTENVREHHRSSTPVAITEPDTIT
jgi:hypothetical protein